MTEDFTDLDTVLLFPDPVEFILLPLSLNWFLFCSATRPKLDTGKVNYQRATTLFTQTGRLNY